MDDGGTSVLVFEITTVRATTVVVTTDRAITVVVKTLVREAFLVMRPTALSSVVSEVNLI